MPSKGERVRGVFRPSDLETIHPSMYNHIGTECMWTYGWIIKKFDPAIDGQWAMVPEPSSGLSFKWTAQEDVAIDGIDQNEH